MWGWLIKVVKYMFAKLLKSIKFLIVCAIWSIFWFKLTEQIILKIWNFDFLKVSQWQFVAEFWRRNGVIYGPSDYLLFLSLLAILVLWGVGLSKLNRLSYVNLLLKPFEYFSDKQIEKYSKETKHVVIKNLVVGEKISVDDLIKQKIEEEGSAEKVKEAENLRQNISKKIIERKGK